MRDRELLRNFITEVIGRPRTPAQILVSIVDNVDQLMVALRVTKDENGTKRLLEDIKKQVAVMRSRSGGTDLFEDVLVVLETLLGKVDEFVDNSSFWSRPSFLGKEKYDAKMTELLENIVNLKRAFTDEVAKYRKLRDELKKVKL